MTSLLKFGLPLNKKILYRQAPLNIDPGVHSSLNLEALARVPTVPNMPGVPPVPTLPTITEAKVADDGEEKKKKVSFYSLTLPFSESKYTHYHFFPFFTLIFHENVFRRIKCHVK